MKKPFLLHIAQDLYEQHGSQISQLYIVLPSRRACVYFKYFLSRVAEQPLFSPFVYSMEDFVMELSNLEVQDHVELLITLFETYKQFDKDEKHTFDAFVPLGTAILRDFNMIDRNLDKDKVEKLFEYLEEVKALERWGIDLGEESNESHNSLFDYLAFWQHLHKTYDCFKQRLLEQGQCYEGMAFRWVSEHLEEKVQELGIETVVFAGFSQLSKVEEEIIKKLIAMKQAVTYWDADRWYVDKYVHEAGEYFRRFDNTWLKEPRLYKENYIHSERKQVEVINAGGKVIQAKIAGKLLQKLVQKEISQDKVESFENAVSHTAILLPDESLLAPLLHALPEFDEQGLDLSGLVNITMGVSLEKTPFFDLLKHLFLMQQNIRFEANGAWKIYYQDLLRLLSHPYLQVDEDAQQKNFELIAWVKQNNLVFLEYEELIAHEAFHPLLEVVFRPWRGKVAQALGYFMTLTGKLSTYFQETKGPENEFLFQFFTKLVRLQNILPQIKGQLSIPTLKHFLFEIIRNTKVPFTGEPIGPIQVMGMLESRTLDFENVIVLSCNEGTLPQGKLLDSIIPFDVRLEMGLPTHQDNDAAYAYTFFRLFHRAKKIFLVYGDPNTLDNAREKSRFLVQLENELQRSSNIQLNYRDFGLPNPSGGNQLLVIEKTPLVLQKVRAKLTFQKGVSPSAINTYIKCPVEFFRQSVMKIEDTLEVEENLEQKNFGTLVHNTLEKLLMPYVSKYLTGEDLKNLSKSKAYIREVMKEVIDEAMGRIVMDRGKNYLLFKVAERLINRFLLQQTTEQNSYYIVCVEKFLDAPVPVSLPKAPRVVLRISGKADRIDIVGNTLRIVDYKTGGFIEHKLKAKNLDELFLNPEKEKIVQLLIYKYLLIKALLRGDLNSQLPEGLRPEELKVSSGFYFFRQINSGFIEYRLQDEPEDQQEFLAYVESFLRVFVKDAMDAGKSFSEEPSDFQPYLLGS
ncbi:PD-(D/E)XK nuclease family protein [Rapidithrix thailandica]|uniref:PD-(D/E)XK nuclease family protein n=1 Tax=Rapidithrix thailandica TaxID=413964 RepID=A0AAW9S3A6_9BACT